MISPLSTTSTNALGSIEGYRPLGGGLAGLFAMLIQGNLANAEFIDSTALQTQTTQFGQTTDADLFNTLQPLKPESLSGALHEVSFDELTKRMESLVKQLSSIEKNSFDGTQSQNTESTSLSSEHALPENTNPEIITESNQISNASEGAQVIVEELQIELTVIKTKIEIQGLSTSSFQTTSQLARAFEKMGMSPAEAQEQADRIDAAIAAMKAYLQGSSGETQNQETDLGLLMAQFTNIENAVSPRVSTAQSLLSIEQTEIQLKASYSKASFESSSNLSSAEKVSHNILKGEPIVQNNQTLTDNPSDTNVPLSANDTEKGTTVEIKGNKGNETNTIAQTMAKNVSGEDIAPQSAERQPVNFDKNKPSLSSAEGTISKVTGQKMFTASIDGAGVHLEYHEVPDELLELDPTLEGGNLEGIEGKKERTFEALLNRPSSQTPWQQMLNRANVPNQANIHMKQLAADGGGEVKFKLNPEELGEVHVELEILDGKVRGNVGVERPEVAEQLARELHKLQQGLEEAGFSFHEDGLAFLVQDENTGGGEQQPQADSDGDALEDEALFAENETSTTQWVSPDSLVDVSV